MRARLYVCPVHHSRELLMKEADPASAKHHGVLAVGVAGSSVSEKTVPAHVALSWLYSPWSSGLVRLGQWR